MTYLPKSEITGMEGGRHDDQNESGVFLFPGVSIQAHTRIVTVYKSGEQPKKLIEILSSSEQEGEDVIIYQR